MKTMRRHLAGFGVPAALIFGVFGSAATRAEATPLYGITFFDQGSCTGCTTAIPTVDVQNDQTLSYSNSFSSSSANGAVANFSGSIADAGLHGYSQINTGSTFDGNGFVGMDAYFFDTFTATGPTGQSGKYQIALNFDGSALTAPGGAELGDYVNTFNLLENGTVIPGIEYSGIVSTLSISYGAGPTDLMTTVNVTLTSGTSVVLGELLQLRSAMQLEGVAPGSLTIDDSDTGFFTVTAPTGFGFSTASGFTYSGAPTTAVPEPASLALFGTGIALLAWKRRRNSQPRNQ